MGQYTIYNEENLLDWNGALLKMVIINDYSGYLNDLVVKFSKPKGVPFSIYNLKLGNNFAPLNYNEIRLLQEADSIYVNALHEDDCALLCKLYTLNHCSYDEIKHKCLIVDNFDEDLSIQRQWMKRFPRYTNNCINEKDNFKPRGLKRWTLR